MLLESKCLFSLLSQLSLIHSFHFSFDFPQSLKRESLFFHMASSKPFAHNGETLRTYKMEFSLALSPLLHSTKPLPIMSASRRCIKQKFPNHNRARPTQDCEEGGMFPGNSASSFGSSPVLRWDQLLSQGPSGQAGPLPAKMKSFLLCESIYKLKFREELLGSPEGQAGSVEWWFSTCSPGKSGMKPEKNKWGASVGRWVAWGVQVGAPLGQTDTEKQKPVPWALLQTSQTEWKPYGDQSMVRDLYHISSSEASYSNMGLQSRLQLPALLQGRPGKLAISNVNRNLTGFSRSHLGTYPGIRVEFS